MKSHYGTMKEIFEKLEGEVRVVGADVISVLGMTMGEGRDCLKYRLLSNLDGIGEWGHEYIR